MVVFYVGIILMALMIGLLSGVSESPVVVTLLPLLFGVITAGGNVYVLWGKKAEDETPRKKERETRARFLGTQFVLFAVFFLLGTWSGVYIKFHPQMVWPYATSAPVYIEFNHEDPQVLAMIRGVDVLLSGDRINTDTRRRIIKAMLEKRGKWESGWEEKVTIPGQGGSTPATEKVTSPGGGGGGGSGGGFGRGPIMLFE